MEEIKKIFKHLNIGCFIEYYHIFEENKDSRNNKEIIAAFMANNEIWTSKACQSRASKGKKIFQKGIEIDALRYIIDNSNSHKVSQAIVDKAKLIYSSKQ